ncbi:MAG: hypothetical protein ABIR03_11740 [Ginsengibacter sp.]
MELVKDLSGAGKILADWKNNQSDNQDASHTLLIAFNKRWHLKDR